MTDRAPISKAQIQAITQARLTHGARGRALATSGTLGFALDHAKARAAVLSELDAPRVTEALAAAGLQCQLVTSAAETRDTYIRRPDLGRRLPPDAAAALRAGGDEGPPDVALVLGDGLSAIAVALNGPAFLVAVAELLDQAGLRVGPVILARQARVALGDDIARALGAQTVVMALGERPGLSAADSLGVYVTHQPGPTTPDSARNCISNIRAEGESPQSAAEKAYALIRAMRRHGLSGVALNQEMENAGKLGPT